MSNTETTKSAEKRADDAFARFEERMAVHEEQTRPKRSREEVIDAALLAVRLQLDGERKKLDAHFHMAAQEQAQRERVQDLEWLIEDLKNLRVDLLGP